MLRRVTGPPARARASEKLAAWGVHLFTASGAVVGVLALAAIARGELRTAAVWMLLALVIDAVDGTLARAARVREVLPGFDGRRLDDMVDFLNYVIVAVVFMAASGHLPHLLWGALPVLASAYGFSQAHAKTEDHFFLGFPSYWNVVALYAWLLDVEPRTTLAWVAALSLAVFVPLKYIYPSQSPVLRRETVIAAAVFVALLALACLAHESALSRALAWLTLAFPAWYVGVSLWKGGLHRPARAGGSAPPTA